MGTKHLLERFASTRDEAAFEALVNQHGPMVLGTCRRMLADPQDVEDAFQATFLVLARRASSIEDAERLGPWLHGVARRVASRSRALSARRNALERGTSVEPSAVLDDALEASELRAALDEELARLPEKYRSPLVLCYLEGLTHDEAAQRLRWPVGTVRSRLAGGRDRLRDRLTRRGLAPASSVPALLARASIPPPLLSATVRLATSAGTIPAHVATLAKGALTAMIWSKLKVVGALGLMTTLTVGGAGIAAQQQGQGGKGQGQAQVPEKTVAPQASYGFTDSERQKLIGEIAMQEAELKVLQNAAESLESRWKAIVAKGNDGRPEDDVKRDAEALAVINQRRSELKALIETATRKIEGLKYQLARLNAQEVTIPETLKPLETQIGVMRKDLEAAIARIKNLERELADERARAQRGVEPPGEDLPAEKPKPAPAGTPGEKPATTMPKMPASVVPTVMQLVGGWVMSTSIEQDQVTMSNTETGFRSTHRFPSKLTSILPVLNGPVGFWLQGPEVRQILVFSFGDKKWYPHDLKEPVTEASPIVGPDEVSYELGRFLYLFSQPARKWTTLELKSGKAQDIRWAIDQKTGKRTYQQGTVLHTYDPKTGEWTDFDTNGPDTEAPTPALPKGNPGPGTKPAPVGTPGEKPATTKPEKPSTPAPLVKQLGADYVLVIPETRDRATILKTQTGGLATQRFSEGVTEIVPIASSGLLTFVLKGPKVQQVAAFNYLDGQWYSQDLKEPTTEARPNVGQQEVTYVIGRFVYVYTNQAKKWAVLELKQAPRGVSQVNSGKMIVQEGNIVHVYNAETGEWTHNDTNAPDTEAPAPAFPEGNPGSNTKPASTGPKTGTKPPEPEPITYTIEGDPTLFMVVSASRDRVTMINSQTKKRETLRLAEPATEIIPIVGPGRVDLMIKAPKITRVGYYDIQTAKWFEHDLKEPATEAQMNIGPPSVKIDGSIKEGLIALSLKGPQFTKLDVFDPAAGEWTTQELREPVKGELAPVVAMNCVSYRSGRFLYIYSELARKWAVLELKREDAGTQGMGGGGMSPSYPDPKGKLIIAEGEVIHMYDAKTGEWIHIETKDEK